MSVITKELLIREYFFISAPIKYDYRCIVYKNESELEQLVQCGKHPKFDSYGAIFLDVAILHGDFCMLLCLFFFVVNRTC
jgi:hypothetical protein